MAVYKLGDRKYIDEPGIICCARKQESYQRLYGSHLKSHLKDIGVTRRGPTDQIWNNLGIKKNMGGTWVAQSVKHVTLGFSSGHNLRVVRSSPQLGSMLSAEST